MKTTGRFSDDLLALFRKSKILGIRAGTQPHRFIGLWVVVVEDRVFVRSWGVLPNGWYQAFRKEPRGTVQIGDQEIPIRAVPTRSERLQEAVDRTYQEKYNTPGALQYVRDLRRAKSKATTTELVPL